MTIKKFKKYIEKNCRYKTSKNYVKFKSTLTVIKLFLMVLIILISLIVNKWNFHQFFYFVFEIIAIYLFSQLFNVKGLKTIGKLVTSFLYFLSLVNVISVAVTGDFITNIMWNNIVNISALGNNVIKIILAIVFLVFLVIFPQRNDLIFNRAETSGKLRKLFYRLIMVLGLISYSFIFVYHQTPLLGWLKLYQSIQTNQKTLKSYQISKNEKNKLYLSYEKSGVLGAYIGKIKKPNLIVIFTEGLSNEVIDGNNSKYTNLTPNLDAFSKETINFTDYFNQSAATYRGIRGQLFSSQQYIDGTEKGTAAMPELLNTKLVSLQSVLKSKGYETMMANPEPKLPIFEDYLEQLGFDKIITGENSQLINENSEKVLPDSQTYQLMLKTAEGENKQGKSFFVAGYTFQTHVGQNTLGKFGDGSNSYLNKFHAMDAAFGTFWQDFKNSSLYKNTIVVFTADHATFPDPGYLKAFGSSQTSFVARVPLMIYYPGQSPETIEVGGRNSLSLTPTLLDMMNYENERNYFLGNSLFSNQISPLQTISVVGDDYYTTQYLGSGAWPIVSLQDQKKFQAEIKQIKSFEKISMNY